MIIKDTPCLLNHTLKILPDRIDGFMTDLYYTISEPHVPAGVPHIVVDDLL